MGERRVRMSGGALIGTLRGRGRQWTAGAALLMTGLMVSGVQAASNVEYVPVDGSALMLLHLSNGEIHAVEFPEVHESVPHAQCDGNFSGVLDFRATSPQETSAEQAERRYELSVLFDPPHEDPLPTLRVHGQGPLVLHVAPMDMPGDDPANWAPEGEVARYDKHWYLQLSWSFRPGQLAEEQSVGSITPTSRAPMLPEGGDDVVVERAELHLDMQLPARVHEDGDLVPCPLASG